MRRRKHDNHPENGFEAWGGYMNAKIAKLEEQFQEQAANESIKKSNIFAGISIFVNGYTKPSATELKVLMAEHGGVYHHYFSTSRTKFIIASNLPDTKVKNLPTTKIIKPKWITDCINAGEILDYRDYLLYSNLTKTQPRLNFVKTDKLESSKTDVANETEVSIEEPSTSSHLNDAEETKNNARTAVNPNFLSEFYNNSRLHHISQLGAAFKEYVNHLRENSDFSFPGRDFLLENKLESNHISLKKVIMHIDMDCFFVSVGLRKFPHLRGKAVAVTHAKNTDERNNRNDTNVKAEFNLYRKRREEKLSRYGNKNRTDENSFDAKPKKDFYNDDNFGSLSEIASCSYEARACGIHNGMFMGPALKLCPDLHTIPYDFEAYKDVAYTLYDTIARYTLDIEAVSCDEMYVDCTELLNEVKLTPLEFAAIIRKEIQDKTGCPCSTGFGSNRLQARMATKKAKPNGQYYLLDENVEEYFSNILLGDLPGVGRQLKHKLSDMGYKTCESLRSMPLSNLQKHFGNKTGKFLYQYCRGIDERPLNFTIIRKSISAGVNYGIRFQLDEQCFNFFRQLSEEVSQRMKHHSVKGKAITLKLMVRAEDAPVETAKFMGHGVCDAISKTSNLTQYTDNADLIYEEVLLLYKKCNFPVTEMRGINIQVTKLENTKACKKGGLLNYIKNITKNGSRLNIINSESKPNIIDKTLECDIALVHNKINVSPEKPQLREPNIQNRVNVTKTIKTLGISRKRRGRPPKNIVIHEKNTAKLDTFINANIRKSSKSTNIETVDEEFLNALPEDIRNELIENMKLNIFKTSKKQIPEAQKSEIDPEYLAALPAEIRKEIETNTESYKSVFTKTKDLCDETPKNKDTNDITNLNWNDIKTMLKDWVKSESIPLKNDIEMIKSYMRNLVIEKMLTRVYYLMNFLYREIDNNKNNCVWHEQYLSIVENVQSAMLMIYGHKLQLKTKYACCSS